MESEGASILAETLSRIPSLKTVKLPQNAIRPDGIQSILKAFSSLSLHCIDLQDNTFTLSGTKALVEALPSWPLLRILNVGECLLGKQGCNLLVLALTEKYELLEQIYLSYNEMDERCGDKISSMLQGKKISLLELNGNTFECDAGCVSVIKQALEDGGFPNALDELDDMEEISSGEEDDSEEEDDDEEEEKEEKSSDTDDELANITKKLQV